MRLRLAGVSLRKRCVDWLYRLRIISERRSPAPRSLAATGRPANKRRWVGEEDRPHETISLHTARVLRQELTSASGLRRRVFKKRYGDGS